MHGYIGISGIEELCRKDRKAYVIPNLDIKDVDEYINSCTAILSSNSINPSIFVQPKVITLNHKTSIIFCLRAGINENELDIAKLNNWLYNIGAISIKDFLRNHFANSRNKSISADELIDRLRKGKAKAVIKMSPIKKDKREIRAYLMLSEDMTLAKVKISTHEYVCNIEECKCDLTKIITKAGQILFKAGINYIPTMLTLSDKVTNTVYKFNIDFKFDSCNLSYTSN